MAKQVGIVIDCRDPGVVGPFWQAALEYVQEPPPEGYASWADWDAEHGGGGDDDGYKIVDPDGAGPTVFFQPVPEPKTIKNRVHIDIRVSGGGEPAEQQRRIRAAVPALVAAGATELYTNDDPDDWFITLADPEGNEFCLV